MMKWMLAGMFIAAGADIVAAIGIWWLVSIGPPDCVVEIQRYIPRQLW